MKELPIFWSPLAQQTYLNTLSQILDRWTIKEAEDFEAKVLNLITLLRNQRHLCPPSGQQKNLRRCVLTPQTSLIYQIRDATIEIVAFIDNRSEHSW